MLDSTSTESTIPKPKSSSEFISYDHALKHFFGNLTWRAVHALLDHQDFKDSPLWIAKNLGIEVEEAVEALEGLEVLGLVQKTSEGLKKKKLQFIIPDEHITVESRQHKHGLLSQQMLNKLSPEKRSAFYNNLTTSNFSLVKKLNEKIIAAIEEFHEESKSCVKDGLYGTTYTTVSLMDQDGGKQ